MYIKEESNKLISESNKLKKAMGEEIYEIIHEFKF